MESFTASILEYLSQFQSKPAHQSLLSNIDSEEHLLSGMFKAMLLHPARPWKALKEKEQHVTLGDVTLGIKALKSHESCTFIFLLSHNVCVFSSEGC